MIEIQELRKTYRLGEHEVQALAGVSLTIAKGDFVAVMGPSGSGKSTLTQILGLLDSPSGGRYFLAGRDISDYSEDELAELRRERIGFIFQQFNLLPRLSAEENVAVPLLYSNAPHRSALPARLLEQIGLDQRLAHRSNELSGGQQQRVAIARALVNEPDIIFADEPTGNLDSASEKEIMAILRDLNARGITIVMVTHEEEIAQQARRIIRMRDGLVQSDLRLQPIPAAGDDLAPPGEGGRQTSKPAGAGGGSLAVFQYFNQGIKSLMINKVRTVLSMLGITIGVAAVIAMLALGSGAQKAIQQQLSSLGSNLLVLQPGARRVGGVAQDAGAVTRLTLEDAKALEALPSVKATNPTVNGRAQVTFANKNWSTQATGVSPSYAEIRAASPTIGRFFTDDELRTRARVALLGLTVARELFGSGNPVGEMIKINRVSFAVIGVLPEKGATGWRDQDDLIIMPATTAMYRLFGKPYVDNIDIEVDSIEAMPAAQERVMETMLKRHRVPAAGAEEAFQVRNMADIQEAVSQSSKTMSLLLASIAGISLLVGGIGIMNIMLVSVTERTKEIGLRKAVGARRSDILAQFLAESIAVTFVGGAAGITLGAGITYALSALAGWSTAVTIESMLLACSFSVAIGMIFGIYPARKASRLKPIQALRYE